MTDFEAYIQTHLLRKLTAGKSGAEVFLLDDQRVAKRVRRSALKEDHLWHSYLKEARFYTCFSSKEYSFLPEVFYCWYSDEEIRLVMKEYRLPDRYCFDDCMLERIMTVLAQIHNLPVPDFLIRENEEQPFQIDDAQRERCMQGWQAVINEHGSTFSKADLQRVAETINAVNQKCHTSKRCCCHGDFHFDNLLEDDDGKLIVCDWQGVGVGQPSGDISFFLSRLHADGVNVSRDKAIRVYCESSNGGVTEQEIDLQMRLANLNTSFLFWYSYLHGSAEERVAGIFKRMVADADHLRVESPSARSGG